jgi:hypothetical protein
MYFKVCAIVLGLGFGLILTGCSKPADKTSSDPKISEAQSYVKSVFAGDMSALSEVEDQRMQKSMQESVVKDVTSKMIQANGDLKGYGTPRKALILGHDVVYVPCEFEKVTLDAKVVLDKTGKVAGFFFVAAGGV